jgi:hypothetical protein
MAPPEGLSRAAMDNMAALSLKAGLERDTITFYYAVGTYLERILQKIRAP